MTPPPGPHSLLRDYFKANKRLKTQQVPLKSHKNSIKPLYVRYSIIQISDRISFSSNKALEKEVFNEECQALKEDGFYLT